MPVQLPSYPIFNLLVYLMLCAIYVLPIYKQKGIGCRQRMSTGFHFRFFFIICTLFCVFAFSNGDFYNYYIVFKSAVISNDSGHFEEPYTWIITHCTHDYLLWRFIIWGGATFVTLWAIKRMNIACIPACAAFTLFYLTTLYVMRGKLGAGIMLLGLTYIFWPRRHLRIIDLVL